MMMMMMMMMMMSTRSRWRQARSVVVMDAARRHGTRRQDAARSG